VKISRYLLSVSIIFVLFSCDDDIQSNVENEAIDPELEAIIETGCPTFNVGVLCELKDISTGRVSSREWIFENAEPTSSTQEDPTISFKELGKGTITLVVRDELANLSDTAKLEVTVFPSDGLIAYYPLDNSAEDFSGNGYHGIINGTESTKDVNENEDAAIKLNSFIDNIETSSEIDDFLGNGVTFSAWIKTEENFDLGPIISNLSSAHIDSCQSYTGFQFYYGSERGIGLSYFRGGKDFGKRSDEHNNFGVGEWHHVSASWNGELDFGDIELLLYIDGEKTSGSSSNFSNSPDQCPYTESPIPFYIGRPFEEGLISTSRAFVGCLDEIRIYSRALDPDEIRILAKR